jgi:branched-chain amino acid transport system substrate-binding protein
MSCRTITALLLIVSVALTVGCDKSSGGNGANGGNASSGDTIKIGHVASKTGDTATFGVSADEGIRLAMDQVNAEGGVLGKKVEVIT